MQSPFTDLGVRLYKIIFLAMDQTVSKARIRINI